MHNIVLGPKSVLLTMSELKVNSEMAKLNPNFLHIQSIYFTKFVPNGQSMSSFLSSAPLINIKKAISVLKSELKGLNIQIGVSDHTLLQARMRDKNSVQNNAKIGVHWVPCRLQKFCTDFLFFITSSFRLATKFA